MLRIDITPLGAGAHQLKLEPEAQALGLDPETFGDISVDAHLFCQRRDRILVVLEAQATAALRCDRTLRPFEQRIEGSYTMLFAAPGTAAPAEENDDYEEVHELLPSDREIDVTDAVRDTLLLAVPQRKVAPGAEEEALQTRFGTADEDEEDAIDPRWAALRKLQSGEEAP